MIAPAQGPDTLPRRRLSGDGDGGAVRVSGPVRNLEELSFHSVQSWLHVTKEHLGNQFRKTTELELQIVEQRQGRLSRAWNPRLGLLQFLHPAHECGHALT